MRLLQFNSRTPSSNYKNVPTEDDMPPPISASTTVLRPSTRVMLLFGAAATLGVRHWSAICFEYQERRRLP